MYKRATLEAAPWSLRSVFMPSLLASLSGMIYVAAQRCAYKGKHTRKYKNTIEILIETDKNIMIISKLREKKIYKIQEIFCIKFNKNRNKSNFKQSLKLFLCIKID